MKSSGPLSLFLLLVLSVSQLAAQPAKGKDLYGDPLPPGAIARLGTIRLRPGTTVKMLAFSPDGKTLASYAQEQHSTPVNFLSFWDVARGQELRRVDMLHGQLHALNWPAKGPARAVGKSFMFETDYQLWNVADDKEPQPTWDAPSRTEQYKEFTCFALSEDGTKLAGGGKRWNDKPRPILVWDKLAPKVLDQLPKARALGDQPCDAEWLGFTPDQRRLVALNRLPDAKDFELAVWDLEKGEQTTKAMVPRPYRNPMHFSGGVAALTPDNKAVALGMADGRVLFFDLATGKETASLLLAPKDPKTKRQPGVSAVAFAAKGDYLIAGLTNGFIVKWDLILGKEGWRVAVERFAVDVLALSADGKRVASGSYQGVIRIADTTTGADVCPQSGNNGWLWHASVSPDGRKAATLSLDRLVRFWDLAEGKLLPTSKMPEAVDMVQFLTDDKLLIRRQGKLAYLSRDSGELTDVEGELAKSATEGLKWFPDKKTVATFKDQQVFLWDWPSGKLRNTLDLPFPKDPSAPKIQHLAIDPDGKRILAVSFSFTSAQKSDIYLWEREGDPKPRLFPVSFLNYPQPIFSPDGMGLLIPTQGYTFQAEPFGKWEDALRLVDATKGTILRSYVPPQNPRNVDRRSVRSVTASPDGRTLASVEGDHTVVLFETATGLVRKHLVGHRGNVLSADFTPDGKRLITSGQDNTALVWDISLVSLASKPPQVEGVPQAWADLLAGDAAKVRQALATMTNFPKDSLPLIQRDVPPRPKLDEQAIAKLIKQLEALNFAEREKAFAALDRYGDALVVTLRATLAKDIPLETVRRLERLLAKHDPVQHSPHRLREMRALEILEQLGTPEARKLLASLASGDPSSRRTQDAAAALGRLQARQAEPK